MLEPRHIRAMATLGIVVATSTLAGFAREPGKPLVVYHDGARIQFRPRSTGTHRMARFGPWDLGERLKDSKLRDSRLNLYVVVPGEQYRSWLHRRYNHTLVINRYTLNGRPREWDVFWCLALDPSLRNDLHSERELLVAANERFHPAKDFKVQQVRAHAVMAEELDVTSTDGLRRFRHRDGSLPRLLIVPAHMAVRATAAKRQ